MKYMLLLYGNQASWDAMGFGATPEAVWRPDDVRAAVAFMDALLAELSGTGELVATHGLAEPAHTRTVRLRDDVPAVTDGPFPKAKEVLAGYLLVDCASVDRATEIAARVARSPVPEGNQPEPLRIEVRPVLEEPMDGR